MKHTGCSGRCGSDLAVTIGIGDAEASQNLRFESLYDNGFCVRFMIIAQQMQQAMDGQVRHMIEYGYAPFHRFPPNGLSRQNDVAEEPRGLRDR